MEIRNTEVKEQKRKKHTRLTDLVLRICKTRKPQIGSLYHSPIQWHTIQLGNEWREYSSEFFI